MKISLSLFTATVVAVTANHSSRDDIHVLMYETDESIEHDPSSPLSFFKERSTFANLPTTVYGGGQSYKGFGDKYQTLRSVLDAIDPNKIVVVADARDVALNIPENGDAATKAIDRFVETYRKLTKDDPGAVVMSAEGQCCVSAMTHAHPREYFDPITKKRAKRACSSGKEGCYWNQNDNIYAWVDFHRQRAFDKTGIPRNVNPVGDVYLNAGLMAGYPADLMNLVDVLDIHSTEDDQAVLSGLMYQFPDMIVLDYGQEMFGNNQWPRGLIDGCIYEKEEGTTDPKQSFLVHTETGTEPLIIHTPGKFYGCLDVLIEELGGTSQQRYLHESPQGNPRELKRKGFKFDTPRKLNERNEGPPEAVEKCGCDCSHPISDGQVYKEEVVRESIKEAKDNNKAENNNDDPNDGPVEIEEVIRESIPIANDDKKAENIADEPNGDIEADVNEGRLRRRHRRLGVRVSVRRYLFARGEESAVKNRDGGLKGDIQKSKQKLAKELAEKLEAAPILLDTGSDTGPDAGLSDGLSNGESKSRDKDSGEEGPDQRAEPDPGQVEEGVTNYGYGSYGSYGSYDVATNYGYGAYGSYGVAADKEELPGPDPDPVSGQVEEGATNYGYGSYGSYGVATNYEYGSYGSYGVATNNGYGSYGIATNYGYGSYGVAINYGYGSYGVATNDEYGSYGQYNQYSGSSLTGRNDDDCADICASHCYVADGVSSTLDNYGQYVDTNNDGGTSTSENYGQYGIASDNYGVASNYGSENYGQYGVASNNYGVASNYGSENYGQYGVTSNNYGIAGRSNYGYGVASNYAPGNYGQYGIASNYASENYGQYGASNNYGYGVASNNYGYGVASNYGQENYGQYGEASNYGNGDANYGQYGYGQYGSNYGSSSSVPTPSVPTPSRRIRRVRGLRTRQHKE